MIRNERYCITVKEWDSVEENKKEYYLCLRKRNEWERGELKPIRTKRAMPKL